MSHVDITSFRTIIKDWFDQREVAESDAFGILTAEEKVAARHTSFIGKIKQVIWALEQQKADVSVLKNVLKTWFYLDIAHMDGVQPRPYRENALFCLIEDYFVGQGYKTRSGFNIHACARSRPVTKLYHNPGNRGWH